VNIDFTIQDSEILSDVKIITPSIFTESRGSIWTSFKADKLNQLLPENLSFSHDKFSTSYLNVLRGIHGDNKSWKLVSCIGGQIFQVVVDLRESSDSFLKWESFILGDSNRQMILIPPGMGNAFYVQSNEAIYHYKLAYKGEYADADEQFTISWNDNRFNINWPTQEPILSERDMRSENGNN
tara:strand:- start:189 stop:734 length:546 start_codon:yes stop_codon:yes gene_type:complete